MYTYYQYACEAFGLPTRMRITYLRRVPIGYYEPITYTYYAVYV